MKKEKPPKFLVTSSSGLQPNSDGLQPNSDGLQPYCDGLHLSAMASNLIASLLL